VDNRLTGRGMKSMMALVAVSRKLLRIIHAILRDDGEYIVNYGSVKRQVIKKQVVWFLRTGDRDL
jgi:hypothetical protein